MFVAVEQNSAKQEKAVVESSVVEALEKRLGKYERAMQRKNEKMQLLQEKLQETMQANKELKEKMSKRRGKRVIFYLF